MPLRSFVEFRGCPLRSLQIKQNMPFSLSNGQQPCLFVGQYVDYQHSYKERSFKDVIFQCFAQKPEQRERPEIAVRHLGGIVTDMIVTVPVLWLSEIEITFSPQPKWQKPSRDPMPLSLTNLATLSHMSLTAPPTRTMYFVYVENITMGDLYISPFPRLHYWR